MEVDTRAAYSLISKTTYDRLWSKSRGPQLQETKIKLHTYTVDILGAIQVKVKYSDQQENLGLLVVAGSGPSLLGRDWLNKIQLNWASICLMRVSPEQSLHQLLEEYLQIIHT